MFFFYLASNKSVKDKKFHDKVEAVPWRLPMLTGLGNQWPKQTQLLGNNSVSWKLKLPIFERPLRAIAGVGGIHSEKFYGAVECLIHRLQQSWQTLAVVTWYSAQKNMLKTFVDKTDAKSALVSQGVDVHQAGSCGGLAGIPSLPGSRVEVLLQHPIS